MFGIGTLVNTGLVFLGGLIGLVLKKGISEKLQATLISACGIASAFIGISGTVAGMLTFENGKFGTTGAMLLIFSLVIGGFFGELIDIEKHMEGFGERLKKRFGSENDGRFVEGFVTASLIMCVGAMTIVGGINDGMIGGLDGASMLIAKGTLDFVMAIILASTCGVGVLCSAGVILVYQGAIALASHFLGNFFSDALVADLSFVGSALIFGVGVNLIFGKKIKVGNLLPALLVPCVYELILHFVK